ncbi:hypothetical protein AgCh_039450 [Apium graveolens]
MFELIIRRVHDHPSGCLVDHPSSGIVVYPSEVLKKYDQMEYFHIGMPSQSVCPNIWLSFNMAFGGAGHALSYPLAKAVPKNLDLCLKRYPTLYGSDQIMHFCIADLGVSLTLEKGFHQLIDYEEEDEKALDFVAAKTNGESVKKCQQWTNGMEGASTHIKENASEYSIKQEDEHYEAEK